MSEWQRSGELKALKFVKERIAAWINSLRTLKPGADRARRVHSILDTLLLKRVHEDPELSGKSSCKVGCSFCCNIQVMISDDEADLLYELVRDGKVDVDLSRLEKQKDWGEDDYPNNYLSGDAACVFLDKDTKTCKIYEDRPTACRTYFVASDPAQCSPEKTTGVLSLFSADVACFEAAALSVGLTPDSCGKKRTIPALLLERIRRDEQSSSH